MKKYLTWMLNVKLQKNALILSYLGIYRTKFKKKIWRQRKNINKFNEINKKLRCCLQHKQINKLL